MMNKTQKSWFHILLAAYHNKRLLIMAIIIIAGISIVFEVTSPLIGKRLFDVALPSQDFRQLIVLGLIWFMLVFGLIVLQYLQATAIADIDLNAVKNIRTIVLKALLIELGKLDSVEQKHGAHISHILSDPEMSVSNSGIGKTISFFTSTISFAVLTILAIYLDWVMAVLCVGAAFFSLVLQKEAPEELVKRNQVAINMRAHVTNVLENLVAAWRTIIRFGTIDRESNYAKRQFDKLVKSELSAKRLRFRSNTKYQLLTGSMPILLMWLGAYRMVTGMISLGTLVAFFSLLWAMNERAKMAFYLYLDFSTGLGQAREIIDLIVSSMDDKGHLAPKPPRFSLQSIVINDLTLQVGQLVLKAKRLEFKKGNTYLLTGDSGTGKSLFLEVLAGIRKPNSVRIYLDNKACSFVNYMAHARNFGYVCKEEHLFERPVRDNISYNCHTIQPNECFQLAGALNIDNKIEQSVGGLSAGEISRISFIRELTREPKVFIIDEGLDSVEDNTKKKMFDLIHAVNPDCIVIVCTHNWCNLRSSYGTLTVQNGQIYQHATDNVCEVTERAILNQ